MISSGHYLMFRTLRKTVILFYNLVVLTSIIATAIRDLHCDAGVPPLGEELRSPMQSRRTMANTSDAWHRRILYAAAAVAGTRKSQGVHPQPRMNANTQSYDGRFGRKLGSPSSNTTNGQTVISEACGGAHGLELQQDNTTFYIEGLPVYGVTVINTCLDCSLQDIHIACGDWASATEVDPLVFKRVTYNDCVVNDGKPISSQAVVFFEYANSFPYPMQVRSSSPSC